MPDDAEGYFLIPVDADATVKLTRIHVEPDAERVDAPSPTWRTAVHEAAHAVVSLGLGRPIDLLTVQGQPMCVLEPSERDSQRSASIAMSGPHGETLIVDQRINRPLNREVVRSLSAVRSFHFGSCDACNIAFALVHQHGLDATDAELIRSYRAIESATIEVLHEPLVQSAVRELANELLLSGTIYGDSALRIVGDVGVDVGSMKTLFNEVMKENAGSVS